MSVGYDSTKVPAPTSLRRPAQAGVQGQGRPQRRPDQGRRRVRRRPDGRDLANGGTAGDITKGVDFFKKLKDAGNFMPVDPTPATIASGQTAGRHRLGLPQRRADAPRSRLEGLSSRTTRSSAGYYVQAINKDAPHPAAARLWQEFLYSDEGQNLWLKGGARPVRFDDMKTAGTLDPRPPPPCRRSTAPRSSRARPTPTRPRTTSPRNGPTPLADAAATHWGPARRGAQGARWPPAVGRPAGRRAVLRLRHGLPRHPDRWSSSIGAFLSGGRPTLGNLARARRAGRRARPCGTRWCCPWSPRWSVRCSARCSRMPCRPPAPNGVLKRFVTVAVRGAGAVRRGRAGLRLRWPRSRRQGFLTPGPRHRRSGLWLYEWDKGLMLVYLYFQVPLDAHRLPARRRRAAAAVARGDRDPRRDHVPLLAQGRRADPHAVVHRRAAAALHQRLLRLRHRRRPGLPGLAAAAAADRRHVHQRGRAGPGERRQGHGPGDGRRRRHRHDRLRVLRPPGRSKWLVR